MTAADRPPVTDNARTEAVEAIKAHLSTAATTTTTEDDAKVPARVVDAHKASRDCPECRAIYEPTETTTATVEDAAQVLYAEYTRANGPEWGAVSEAEQALWLRLAHALDRHGLLATARTRPTRAQVMEAIALHLGWQPGLIEAADAVLALLNEEADR